MIASSEVGSGRRLRAGVIGAGYLGRFHAQKYRALPEVELVAVADSNPDNGRRVAEELGVAFHADFHDLLSHVDLVSVVVPTPAHFAVASATLRAGVHALVEKPITTTLAEADALIQLAEKHHCVLQVGHLKRFHPAVAVLRERRLVQRCRFIECQRLAPFKGRGGDVDVTLDLMIHDVDLVLHFMASEVVAIEAVGRSIVTKHIDVAQARLHFANGAVATFAASRLAPAPVRSLRLLQDDGVISLDFITKQLHVARQRPEFVSADVSAHMNGVGEVLPVPEYDTLEAQIRAFCHAVRSGTAPIVTGSDGRHALQVVTAIRAAMEPPPTTHGIR
ncbi:MAG: Gfo/Idh/MocA family oxidoreductase [Magnetococcales bacterium]|nr:Gfo/Idh/MocA family oxidoreductase [Magnetococcales bacterium]